MAKLDLHICKNMGEFKVFYARMYVIVGSLVRTIICITKGRLIYEVPIRRPK